MSHLLHQILHAGKVVAVVVVSEPALVVMVDVITT